MPVEKIKIDIEKAKEIKPSSSWIYLDSDPLLREKSSDLTEMNEEIEESIMKMVSYIDNCYYDNYEKYKIRPGIAIAAPQVGLLKKIIYVHFDDNGIEHRYLLANPEIVSKSQSKSYIDGGEGCLSVPKDVIGNIPRNYKIIVKAYDLINNQPIEITATNLLSVCLQHEIDHLHGILYTDLIDEKQPNYHDSNWIKIN